MTRHRSAHGDPDRPLRVAQLANFVGPTSGGLRTVVEALGSGHLHSGTARLLIVPGPESRENAAVGLDRRVSVGGPTLPGSRGDYHVLWTRRQVAELLERFRPDLIEVHDQTTLAWVARWARRHGVLSVLFAHERLDLVAAETLPVAAGIPAMLLRQWSARLADDFDAVVCASAYAAQPFIETGAQVHRIPFGVDLETFHPDRTPDGPLPWREGTMRLICVGRLHAEKVPAVALDVLAALRADGVDAELAMVGSGPLETPLRDRARRQGLPVHFLGHQSDRHRLAGMIASADVALAPCARETFALSALEAMATGTPVVVSDIGASRELLAPRAGAAAGSAPEMAAAARALAEDPGAGMAARARAEQFSWTITVQRVQALEAQLVGASLAGGRIRAARLVPARLRAAGVTVRSRAAALPVAVRTRELIPRQRPRLGRHRSPR